MSLFSQNNFWARKIHSLLGVIPLGAFLVEHLVTNSFAKQGAVVYNEKIEWIQSMPYLLGLEIGLIGIPILLHAGLGIFYLWGWKDNSTRQRYPRNFMYTLQRVTGILVLLFIGYHVWEFRIATAIYDIPVNYALVAEKMTSFPHLLMYIVGITATVVHFANGIWGFLIHWGITVGPKAQRISSYICAGMGLTLLYIGIDALFAFVN